MGPTGLNHKKQNYGLLLNVNLGAEGKIAVHIMSVFTQMNKYLGVYNVSYNPP